MDLHGVDGRVARWMDRRAWPARMERRCQRDPVAFRLSVPVLSGDAHAVTLAAGALGHVTDEGRRPIQLAVGHAGAAGGLGRPAGSASG